MKCNSIGLIITLSAFLLLISFGGNGGGGTNLCLAKPDDCDKCGPTRMIGCRNGRCYYKCIRRCLGKDNKFYYEALKFNFAGQ